LGANGSDGALTDLEEGFVADKWVVGVVWGEKIDLTARSKSRMAAAAVKCL
jgi:hypothetical protein